MYIVPYRDNFNSCAIKVHIDFSDGSGEYELSDIKKSKYFQKILNTSIIKETLTKKDTHGQNYNVDVYTIPHLKVTCRKSVFETLMCSEEPVFCKPYTDLTLELFVYNKKYEFYKRIGYPSFGFRASYCMDLLPFIKRHLPNENAYAFLKSGRFQWTSSLIDYSFRLCAQGKLYPKIIFNDEDTNNIQIHDSDDELIGDLIEMIPHQLICIQINKLRKEMYHIFKTIEWCCDNIIECKKSFRPLFTFETLLSMTSLNVSNDVQNIIVDKMNHEFIKNHITDDLCIQMLTIYVDCWKYCQMGYDQPTILTSTMIQKFNIKILKVYDIIKKLARLNIIDMSRIGDIDSYKSKLYK